MLNSYYTDMPSIVICADGRLLSCYYDGRMNRDSWPPMIWCEVLRDE